jgi:hypothetical protein
MINLKVGKNKLDLPNEWSEITIKQYAKIVSILQKYEVTPEQMKEKTKEENEFNAIRANVECFAFLTNSDVATIEKCPSVQIEKCLDYMLKFLNAEESTMETREIKTSFNFKNETYYFPTIDFKETTFGDYIEAAQLNMLMNKKEGLRFAVLPEQMAILCKTKEQENGYDEKRVLKRSKVFQDLPMNIVWDFVFFLTNLNAKLRESLRTFSKEEKESVTDTQQQIGKS